ncbi:hypothetical protein TNCV_1870341 [Trichonephila clavipes]|nr:hypothetical protein TNCV_1870341 [Trichonephila clavipes]
MRRSTSLQCSRFNFDTCVLKTKLSDTTAHEGQGVMENIWSPCEVRFGAPSGGVHYAIGPRPTVPISVYVTLGTEVHEQMYQLGVQPETKPPVFSSQASLVLIY